MRAMTLVVLLAALPLAGCAGGEDDDGNGGDGVGVGAENCVGLEPDAPDKTFALMATNHGCIVLELFGDKAPQTVKNFGTLSEEGFYDEVKFHRVIGPSKMPPTGFMNQAGDPKSKQPYSERNQWGTGGPGYRILDEFYCKNGTITNALPANCELGLSFTGAGQLAMANKGSAKTGGSQWFITLSKTDWLSGKHTIFGEVFSGMDVVREIGNVQTDAGDRPVEDVVIEGITIQGELPDVTVQKFAGD